MQGNVHLGFIINAAGVTVKCAVRQPGIEAEHNTAVIEAEHDAAVIEAEHDTAHIPEEGKVEVGWVEEVGERVVLDWLEEVMEKEALG